MGLLRVVGHVVDEWPPRANADGGGRHGRPVAEQVVDTADEIIPVDPAGDGDDHPTGLEVVADESADVVDADRFHVGRDALGGHPPRRWAVDPPQGGYRAMGRVVLDAGQILEDHLAGSRQLILGQQRSPEDVGVDREDVGQMPGHHGAREAGMGARHAL